MDFFDHPSFKINKNLLSIVGQWSFQSPVKKLLLRSFIFIAFVSLIIPQVICYCELWGGDLDGLLERTLPLLTTSIYALKGLVLVINEEKIKKLLNTIKRDWDIWSSEPEFEMLQAYAKQGRRVTRNYASTTLIYLLPPMVPFLIDTITSRNETGARRFIYQADYGLKDNEKYFFFIMMHDYVAAYAKIATSLASDTMFMVLAQHACGVFSSIGHKMENIDCDDIHFISKSHSTKEKKINEEIILCVNRHRNAIQFVIELETSFALSYLVQTIITVIIISLIGFEVLLNLDKPQEAVRFILFLLGHMYGFFFINLPCQRVMDHSNLLFSNTYISKWYEMPIKCRKLLIMIMMRSMKPCKITAGKIYVLNMESYSGMLRASMSYFTMITSFR